MDNFKWTNGIKKVESSENKERAIVRNAFMKTMTRNGFAEVDLSTLDYSEKYIINNEYHMAQDHYKCVAPNGEVLSVVNDVIAGLISFSESEIDAKGKICTYGEEFGFLSAKDGGNSRYTYGGLSYGVGGVADEADIILAGLDFCSSIGIKAPTVLLGNTEIFRGVLNIYAKREEGLDRVKKIVAGNIENDVDYAVSQTIQGIKNIECGSDTIKDLATKLENKQSIDGLLNVFEISNILETYNGFVGLRIKPGYLGHKRYDRGMTFAIIDEKGREIVYGARCDCLKNDVVRCIYLEVDADNALIAAKECGFFEQYNDKRITMAVAPTETALAKSYKVRKDFVEENVNIAVIYNVEAKDVYVLMGREESGVVVYIDANGNILHS